MKKLLPLSLFMLFLGLHLQAQTIDLPPSGDNQKSIVTQYIGALAHVTVVYNSPNVTAPDGTDRTGKIWGTPVAHYGFIDQGFGLGKPAPWRVGANECTVIKFSHDVMIEGQPLPAGKYGLFLALAENGPWTWVFSRNTDSWGSYYYDEAEDVLRVNVIPKDHPHTEFLTFEFTDRQPAAATLEMKWELKSVPMRIELPNVNDLYIAQWDKNFQGEAGFYPHNYVNAANYLLTEEYRLDKALEWVNLGLERPFFGKKDFNGLTTKAMIQLKLGQSEEAMATLENAMTMSEATVNQVHQLGRQLIGIGMKDHAMKVFKSNYEKYEAAWPTNVGMARGLSAVGKYDEALKYAQAAHAEAPDDLNKKSLEGMIEKLKMKQDVN